MAPGLCHRCPIGDPAVYRLVPRPLSQPVSRHADVRSVLMTADPTDPPYAVELRRDHQAVPRRRRQPRHQHHRRAAASVHAIVGENGAGKSTLMKILYGMQQPGRGRRSGSTASRCRFRSPADAIAAGIGMVHQHFMLADNFTVLENIVLGSEPTTRRPARPGGRAQRIARDLRRLRPGRRARRAGRGPRRRRPAAGRDPQGALPRRPHPDPRRAHRGARAAGGRRAVRQPARAQGRGPDRAVHLAQARRGARGRRRRSP